MDIMIKDRITSLSESSTAPCFATRERKCSNTKQSSLLTYILQYIIYLSTLCLCRA